MNVLKPENGTPADGPVVRADYIGPDVQYSHGLSIYFPWSKPREDANDKVIENYEQYAFTSDFADPLTWFKFLETYFERTERPDRVTEEQRSTNLNSAYRDPAYTTFLDTARESFAGEIPTRSRDVFPTSVLEGKITPPDSGGGACSCASTKNYSRVFSMSPGVAPIFGNTTSTTSVTSTTGATGPGATGGSAPAPGGPGSTPTQRGGPSQP